MSAEPIQTHGEKECPSPGENYWSDLIDEKQAGQFLKLTDRTLQAYRCRGGGPKFIRISARCIRYRRSDLQKWINGKFYSSTSEYPTPEHPVTA